MDGWLTTGLGVAGAAALAGAHGVFWPRSRIFAPVVASGDRTGRPRVALTFDDGPRPGATERVLAILRQHGVRAAFFVIGVNAKASPDLLRRMDAEGHLVGNHSFDHADTAVMRGRGYWRDQLERTAEAVEAAIGLRTGMFRPPMGFKWMWMAQASAGTGHAMVTWTRRAFDGVPTTPDKIERRLVAPAGAGEVLLLHDGATPGRAHDPGAMIEALPRVILGLRARGIEPVRLDELIGLRGYAGKNF